MDLDIEQAAAEAQRAIHDHNLGRLTMLLTGHPALLSWTGDENRTGLVGFATGAYGDAFGAEREAWFTRIDAAELLIDAGAVVAPGVLDGIIDSRAQGLLQLFHGKGLLPRNLSCAAARGDLEAAQSALDADPTTASEGFIVATNFHHETLAAFLLERAIAHDADTARRIDAGPGRAAFVKYFIDHGAFDRKEAAARGLWKTFVMRHVKDALTGGDLTTFTALLHQERWLMDDEFVPFQADLIGWAATINDRGEFLRAFLDLEPEVLHHQPPPPPQAIDWAFEYGHTSLLPQLTRIWPVPDEVQYAAGVGDLARLRAWFDLHPQTPQRQLDTALAYAISNKQFAAADALLAHGANINTDWNTHEPASLLHHAVFLDDYEILQFLIDRGIDMTIEDYRWSGTAWGWAFYAKKDETMANWLKEQEAKRG